MAHTHKVVDSDRYFVIDPVTRRMMNNSGEPCLMQFNHNSERFTFELPRFLDEHDMSLCNKVEVHYINTDGIFSNDGVYEVEDLRVSGESDDKVICSWLISQNVTQYVGAVNFAIRYACVTDDIIDYQWHTDIHEGITVGETINNSEAAVLEYTDILEQWRTRLFGAGDSVLANIETEATAALDNIEVECAKSINEINETASTQMLSIEAKGYATLETIPEDYTTAYNLANKSARTKATAIVCDVIGETIAVDDSSDDYLRGLKLFGKTTQFTTTGKNLLDLSGFDFNDSEYIHRREKTDPLAIALYEFGRNNTGKSVVMSAKITGTKNGIKIGTIKYFDASNASVFTLYVDEECVIGEMPETFEYMYVYGSPDGASMTNIQIEYGSVATPYEPYTGGIATPNPDYPQDLVSVENPTVSIYGKNLLPITIESGTHTLGLDVLVDSDGSVTINGTAEREGSVGINTRLELPVGKYIVTGSRVTAFLRSKDNKHIDTYRTGTTFEIVDPTNYLFVCVYANNGQVFDNVVTYPMIRSISVEDESYERYIESQSLTTVRTLSGIPVSSGGNYTDANGQQWICDEIDFERGVYTKRIGFKTFTSADRYSDFIEADGIVSSPIEHLPQMPAMCSHYKYGDSFTWANDHYVLFRVTNFGVTNLSEFKAFVDEQYDAGTPLTLMYILATPIETPLTAEELAAFKMARTNYPSTTVLNNSEATMELSYNADTKTYIDNQIIKAVELLINS